MSDALATYTDRIAQAIGDPGSFLPRGDNYAESIPRWGTRAVLLVLADFEATVRSDERRKCAAEVAGIGSYNCELRPDGSEDPLAAAWVEGLHDAHATIMEPLTHSAVTA